MATQIFAELKYWNIRTSNDQSGQANREAETDVAETALIPHLKEKRTSGKSRLRTKDVNCV